VSDGHIGAAPVRIESTVGLVSGVQVKVEQPVDGSLQFLRSLLLSGTFPGVRPQEIVKAHPAGIRLFHEMTIDQLLQGMFRPSGIASDQRGGRADREVGSNVQPETTKRLPPFGRQFPVRQIERGEEVAVPRIHLGQPVLGPRQLHHQITDASSRPVAKPVRHDRDRERQMTAKAD
jgi:hypothetical protein